MTVTRTRFDHPMTCSWVWFRARTNILLWAPITARQIWNGVSEEFPGEEKHEEGDRRVTNQRNTRYWREIHLRCCWLPERIRLSCTLEAAATALRSKSLRLRWCGFCPAQADWCYTPDQLEWTTAEIIEQAERRPRQVSTYTVYCPCSKSPLKERPWAVRGRWRLPIKSSPMTSVPATIVQFPELALWEVTVRWVSRRITIHRLVFMHSTALQVLRMDAFKRPTAVGIVCTSELAELALSTIFCSVSGCICSAVAMTLKNCGSEQREKHRRCTDPLIRKEHHCDSVNASYWKGFTLLWLAFLLKTRGHLPFFVFNFVSSIEI